VAVGRDPQAGEPLVSTSNEPTLGGTAVILIALAAVVAAGLVIFGKSARVIARRSNETRGRRGGFRIVLWLVVGAVGGAALYATELVGIALVVVLFAVAALATPTRGRRLALPAYLLGLGVIGGALTIALSPTGAWSVGASGHSAVCSSTGGCVGSTVTQSAFSLPAIAVFVTAFVIGAIWLSWQLTRSHRPHALPR
jgi:hypothetical protein